MDESDQPTIPPPDDDGLATVPAPPGDSRRASFPTSPPDPAAPAVPGFPTSPPDPAAPDVPGFRVVSTLGRGAMGVVYRAEDTRLKRTVALKMILAGAHAGPDELRRFQIEAEAIARIAHPNIVQIFEVGEHAGLPYCALEYAARGSLAGLLRGEPQEPAHAARMVETLARALHEAHRKDIVHRDLKPANILIAEDGALKVTDFGLAKKLDAEDGASRTGAIMGTPSYMAPEQAEGRVRDVGPCADVYALGAILYEMLTGRPPFRGTTLLETLSLVRTQEPVPPARLQPGVPRDLDTICLKCLEKDPRRRYASAEALGDDLRRFLAGEPIVARPVSSGERAAKWVRRNPVPAALTLALAGAIAAGMAGVFVQWREAVAARDRAEQERRAAVAAQEQERAARRAAESALYAQQIVLAETEWRANRVERAREILGQCPEPLRHWEWGYLEALCRPERLAHAAVGEKVSAVALDAAGRTLAVASYRVGRFGHDDEVLRTQVSPYLELVDVATDESRRLEGATDKLVALAFSPDAKLLAGAGYDGHVRLWDVASARELHAWPAGGPVHGLAFDAGGTRLASAAGVKGLGDLAGCARVWTVSTGSTAWTTTVTGVRFHAAAFTAGDRAAFLAAPSGGADAFGFSAMASRSIFDRSPAPRPELWIVSLPGGEVARHPHAGDALVSDPRGSALQIVRGRDLVEVSPDGAEIGTQRLDVPALAAGHLRDGAPQLAVGAAEGVVKTLQLPGGQEHRTLRGHGGTVRCAAVARDAAVAATGADDGSVRVWDAGASSTARGFAPAGTHVISHALSDDGRLIAWSSETELRVAPAEGGEGRALDASGGPIGALAFGPLARKLAGIGKDGATRVYDVAAGRAIRTLAGEGNARRVAFTPGGERLLVCAWNRLVQVWDLETGEKEADAHGGSSALAVRPDGQAFAAGSAPRPDELTAPLIPDDADFRLVRTFQMKHATEIATVGHEAMVQQLAYAPSGALLASGAADGAIKLWDERAKLVATLSGHTRAVTALAFSRDGARLLSASRDRTLRVWDVPARRPVISLPLELADVDVLWMSPDRARVVMLGGGQIGEWRAAKR